MPLDIIIFAAVALALVWKLKSVLGTRNGDEPPARNPFAGVETPVPSSARPAPEEPRVHRLPAREENSHLMLKDEWMDEAEKDSIKEGLKDIAAADRAFDVAEFMEGATAAFEMIVEAYGAGDSATLQPLLGQKLFEDFSAVMRAMQAKGRHAETVIRRFRETKITEAHQGGLMAYITVRFVVEQSACVKDSNGQVVEGDPEKVVAVENIWTFTRDTRSEDPNWILIKTRAAEL